MSDLTGNFQCSHFVHTNDTESLKARKKTWRDIYAIYIYMYVVDTQKRKLLYICETTLIGIENINTMFTNIPRIY